MNQYQKRDGEKDRQRCGKTRVNDMESVPLKVKCVMDLAKLEIIFKTIPATPVDGKGTTRRRRRSNAFVLGSVRLYDKATRM